MNVQVVTANTVLLLCGDSASNDFCFVKNTVTTGQATVNIYGYSKYFSLVPIHHLHLFAVSTKNNFPVFLAYCTGLENQSSKAASSHVSVLSITFVLVL